MRHNGFSTRRRTGSSRPWLFDERRALVAVAGPAQVLRVDVPRASVYVELDVPTRRGGDVLAHPHRHEHVGGAVENEYRDSNARDAAYVVEAQAHQGPGDEAVMTRRHPASARERRF